MKRSILPLAVLSLVLSGCSGSETPASPSGTPPPLPSVTPTPAPSGSPDVLANSTCNEISFYLNPALASGYVCETRPEAVAEDYVELSLPEYTLVTLEGCPLSDTLYNARIAILPVANYTALRPEVAGFVTDLQDLTSGGPTPVFVESFEAPLPFLPVSDAAQVFFAQYEVLPFADGSGIRFLTETDLSYQTVNNADLFYTYQALTDDGQYWISAILPINHATLPANAEDLPGGVTFDEFIADYEPYITGAVDDLNAQPADSFTPSIDLLDALVASITIEP